jgi:hypothetical protein
LRALFDFKNRRYGQFEFEDIVPFSLESFASITRVREHFFLNPAQQKASEKQNSSAPSAK